MLKPSCDTKTAAYVVKRPKKYQADPNAFGTLPGLAGTCPDSTEACRDVCYVDTRYTAVENLLTHNADRVRELATEGGWLTLADEMTALVLESERVHARRVVQGSTIRGLYRQNWSGDVVNVWHAMAIAECARRTPATSHWIYTRSFFTLTELVGVANLRVLVSADADNLQAAESMAELFGLQVAYMGAQDSPRANRRTVCPATRPGGRNVIETGKSPSGLAGVCALCRLCVDGKSTADVVFNVH